PFREAEFDIIYGQGIVHEGELVDLAVKLDFMQKSGSWFSMGDRRIGQGRDAAKRYLQENPEIAAQLEEDIRRNLDKLSGTARPSAPPVATAPVAPPRPADISADDFNDED
ncbi:MAG: DNA recombination/repair protein RecA, partial [Oscillibacter sp.]|nr:DNA recombination/repair protein RecA [Oscillibacter sp.]